MIAAILFYPVLAFVTWIFYLAVMQLKARRHALPPVAEKLGYAVLVLGYVCDFLFNLASTFIFLELPRELLFTGRVSRLKKGDGWRADLAHWVCDNLLSPIEEGHCG